MEHKAFTAEVKSIEGRTVVGIASVFGNVDSYGDVVAKGAFKKTIKERHEAKGAIKFLWQHDFWSPPIAKIVSLREVGKSELPDKLRELDYVTGGLEVTREYLDTERGNEVLKGIVSGAITEMSFAFDTVKSDIEERQSDEDGKTYNVRVIKEVKLYETSDVLWGANDLTVASKASDYKWQFLLRDIERLLDVSTVVDMEHLKSLSERLLIRIQALQEEAEPEAIPLTATTAQRIQAAKLRLAALEFGG